MKTAIFCAAKLTLEEVEDGAAMVRAEYGNAGAAVVWAQFHGWASQRAGAKVQLLDFINAAAVREGLTWCLTLEQIRAKIEQVIEQHRRGGKGQPREAVVVGALKRAAFDQIQRLTKKHLRPASGSEQHASAAA